MDSVLELLRPKEGAAARTVSVFNAEEEPCRAHVQSRTEANKTREDPPEPDQQNPTFSWTPLRPGRTQNQDRAGGERPREQRPGPAADMEPSSAKAKPQGRLLVSTTLDAKDELEEVKPSPNLLL